MERLTNNLRVIYLAPIKINSNTTLGLNYDDMEEDFTSSFYEKDLRFSSEELKDREIFYGVYKEEADSKEENLGLFIYFAEEDPKKSMIRSLSFSDNTETFLGVEYKRISHKIDKISSEYQPFEFIGGEN